MFVPGKRRWWVEIFGRSQGVCWIINMLDGVKSGWFSWVRRIYHQGAALYTGRKKEVLSSWRLGTWAPIHPESRWCLGLMKQSIAWAMSSTGASATLFSIFLLVKAWKIEDWRYWMSPTSLYWLWSMHLVWPGLTPSWQPFLQEPEEDGTCCPGSLEIKRGCTFPENRRPKLCFTVVQLYSNHLWEFTSIYKMHRPNINITSSPLRHFSLTTWYGTTMWQPFYMACWDGRSSESLGAPFWKPWKEAPIRQQLDNTRTTINSINQNLGSKITNGYHMVSLLSGGFYNCFPLYPCKNWRRVWNQKSVTNGLHTTTCPPSVPVQGCCSPQPMVATPAAVLPAGNATIRVAHGWTVPPCSCQGPPGYDHRGVDEISPSRESRFILVWLWWLLLLLFFYYCCILLLLCFCSVNFKWLLHAFVSPDDSRWVAQHLTSDQ